jgi:periplasmic copper chaperone A
MIRLMQGFAAAVCGFALVAAAPSALAHGATLGDIDLQHPYSAPTPPGATTGGAWIKDLVNKGATDDVLTGASSPAADHVELHSMSMDGNVMRMRSVTGIPLPAKSHVAMAPGGGYHLMLIGIKQPFKVGDRIPLTLRFEKAGTVDVELMVQERNAGGDAHLH